MKNNMKISARMLTPSIELEKKNTHSARSALIAKYFSLYSAWP